MSEDNREAPKRRAAPIGPSLPPHLQIPKKPSHHTRSRSRSPDSKPRKEGDRESWMTEMPKSELRADPLNLKNRQFISKQTSSEPSKEKTAEEKAKEQEQEEFIRGYNRANRSETLMEIHKRDYKDKKVTEKEKDIDEHKFDWERDMNQGTKAGSSKNTAELMSRYGSINSRFSSGSSTKKFL